MLLARLALALVALVACAFFAIGIHQAHDLSGAQGILGGANVTSAQATRARSLLDSAGSLNPDRTVALTRGQLDLRLNDTPAAFAVFRRLVGQEPQNVQAWLGLTESAYGKPVLGLALRKLAELDPLDSRAH